MRLPQRIASAAGLASSRTIARKTCLFMTVPFRARHSGEGRNPVFRADESLKAGFRPSPE
jgi:hypothetical protein